MNDLVETKHSRTSGGEMAFADYGEGPVVVLLHGFPTSSFIWRELVPLLGISEMRAIAPDLIGYGASHHPNNANLGLRAQARYVRELLASQGIDEFAVVGHDLGGGIAQLLAIGGGVRAMVLIDSVAFDAWPADHVTGVRSAIVETPHAVRSAVTSFLERGLAHPERATEELRDALLSPFDGDEGARAFFRAARAIDGNGLAGREAELAAIDAPVMIVWGEDDPFASVAVADRLNETIPTSTLALLPGCSHLLTEDATETVVKLVYEYLRSRFLGEGHGHEQAGPVRIALTHRPDPEF